MSLSGTSRHHSPYIMRRQLSASPDASLPLRRAYSGASLHGIGPAAHVAPLATLSTSLQCLSFIACHLALYCPVDYQATTASSRRRCVRRLLGEMTTDALTARDGLPAADDARLAIMRESAA